MTSNDSIKKALDEAGPTRAGRLVTTLTQSLNISPEAARQRLSRAHHPVERSRWRLLPRREAFFYLRSQHDSELYWNNLLRDLRETGSIYACAIDGLVARGGIVPVDEFAVVSGAPITLKKQVPSVGVAKKLIDLGVMQKEEIAGFGHCFVARSGAVMKPLEISHIRARRLTEGVVLDGLRQWAKKNGIGSYDKITIRGEGHPLKVGQFKWDLTGPSYLLPVRRFDNQNGFVVADVFAECRLDVPHIRYFIRKVQTYQKTSNSGALFPILMAENFTGGALTEGRKAGLMLTTPKNLFGRHVAAALADLVETLKRAADIASVDGDCFYKLLDQLSEIEGRSGNLRGILFELIAAYIAQHSIGGSIECGVPHTHRENGGKTDLDVVCKTVPNAVHVIECKGKIPGGTVSLEEVEYWLGKQLPIMKDYVASRTDLRERKLTYEFWTTGAFEAEAIDKLKSEQALRTKQPIDWKDGKAVRKITRELQLKSISEALDQHFLRHPLARTT